MRKGLWKGYVTTKVPNFQLDPCFIGLMQLQCSMEGTSPVKQHMLSMSISSQNPDKQKKQLELCYVLQRQRTMVLALH